MAAPTSKEDFLRLYRHAFEHYGSRLERFLVRNRVIRLLELYKVLEKEEVSRLGGGRENEAREIVRTVREKDILRCYIGFSRVVKDADSNMCVEVFPFVDHLRDGHPPLPKKNPPKPECVDTVALSRDDAAVIVWFVASKEDEVAVCHMLGHNYRESMLSVPATFRDLLFKEFSFNLRDDVHSLLSPIQICLVAPQWQFPTVPTITAVLHSIRPRPHWAILGGTCVANEAMASPGDLLVVTTKTELPIFPELRHVTELWALKDEPWYVDPLVCDKRPLRGRWEQELALARLYTELKSPEQQRSKWFTGLHWDSGEPLSQNQAFRQIAPNVSEIRKSREASELWEHAEVGDVLPYRPLDPLFSQARASMLYAPSTFPLPHPTTCPEVVFGQVENYTHEESTVACSQEAYSFYAGARQMTNLKYLAAMGVSRLSQGCDEPEYRHYGSCLSAVYLYNVIDYISNKLQTEGK